MRRLLVTTFISLLFSCSNSDEKNLGFTPLSKFKNDTLSISPGTTVTLLAFSGGKENDKTSVYYQQILVLNTKTKDTLSILCPLLKIPEPDKTTGRNYISPLEYSPEKKIEKATFENKNDTLNILLQVMGDEIETSNTSTDLTRYMNLQMVKKELVVENNWIPIFRRKYKTVIGILSFDEDPR